MQRRTIERWLVDAIENDGYRRFDDLHIDEIDPRYQEPSRWLSGIVRALNQAPAIRDTSVALHASGWDRVEVVRCC